jgi:hypothetical protein
MATFGKKMRQDSQVMTCVRPPAFTKRHHILISIDVSNLPHSHIRRYPLHNYCGGGGGGGGGGGDGICADLLNPCMLRKTPLKY